MKLRPRKKSVLSKRERVLYTIFAQEPRLSYELPDPSKRNEGAHQHLRGYFSSPLRDPQGDFARQARWAGKGSGRLLGVPIVFTVFFQRFFPLQA